MVGLGGLGFVVVFLVYIVDLWYVNVGINVVVILWLFIVGVSFGFWCVFESFRRDAFD